MSNFLELNPVNSSMTANCPQQWMASTNDNLAAITTTGYLNDLYNVPAGAGAKVNPGDIFFINYDLDGTPAEGGYTATLSSTNLSLVTGIPGGSGGAGDGTVTSVALTAPAEFAVAGSPITSSGTLAVTKATQTANTLWAGPTTGSAAQPAFRALVSADLPAGAYAPAALATNDIFAGVSNVATACAVGGDLTMTASGSTANYQIAAGVIVNADVNASAAIALTKLAATTVSKALVSDSSGFVAASAVTATELGYVSGVTSAIQTQLNAKATSVLPQAQILVGDNSNVAAAVAVTGDIGITSAGVTSISSNVIVDADINNSAAIAVSKLAATTASKALVSDGSGFIAASATSATEIGYVTGVTSAIQTQLNAKQALAVTGGAADTAGTLTLNGSTPVVVSTTAVSASPIIMLSRRAVGGTPLDFSITAETTGTSFAVTGTATDTSTVNWYIVK